MASPVLCSNSPCFLKGLFLTKTQSLFSEEFPGNFGKEDGGLLKSTARPFESYHMILGTKALLGEKFLFGAGILYNVPTPSLTSAAHCGWSDYELNTIIQ